LSSWNTRSATQSALKSHSNTWLVVLLGLAFCGITCLHADASALGDHFLRMILWVPHYADQIHPHGVRIFGAYFVVREKVVLRGGQLRQAGFVGVRGRVRGKPERGKKEA